MKRGLWSWAARRAKLLVAWELRSGRRGVRGVDGVCDCGPGDGEQSDSIEMALRERIRVAEGMWSAGI